MKNEFYIIVQVDHWTNDVKQIKNFVKTRNFFSDYYTKPISANLGDKFYFKFMAIMKKHILEKRHGNIFQILTVTD